VTAERIRYPFTIMCGRYTLTVDASILADLFDLEPLTELEPRYNIAPTQRLPIVRIDRDGDRRWSTARWGLIPSWAKDEKIGSRLINARAETAADKPSFRSAYKHRRCLVPTDGFFEWAQTPGGKRPHLIRFRDRRPFAFAGLWEVWRPDDDDAIESYTILTTDANDLIGELHHRMPVIVPPDRFDAWIGLGPLGADAAETMLLPFPPGDMEIVPVSTRVNSPRNDDPECLEPAGEQEELEFG
jgi:putative SOS response-associated peptidase YedK